MQSRWSTGIQRFGVNTVQHASAIKYSARRLTGCSHILKTVMQRLTATGRERDIERLTAKDPQCEVASVFGVHPSTISRLWHRFQTSGAARDARGGTCTLLRIKSSYIITSKLLEPKSVKFTANLFLKMECENM